MRQDALRGAQDFNVGRYWLAHESWERAWLGAQESWRDGLKACIQLAAALHLLQERRPGPARALGLRAQELARVAASDGRRLVHIGGAAEFLEALETAFVLHPALDQVRPLPRDPGAEAERFCAEWLLRASGLRAEVPDVVHLG